MLRMMWRGMVAHRVRLVATVVAVMLGVSFVAGTYVLTDTLRTAISQSLTQSVAHVAIIVEGRTAVASENSCTGKAATGASQGLGDLGLTVAGSTVTRVAKVPGVSAADGLSVGTVNVEGPRGTRIASVTSLQLAFSVGTVPSLRSLTLRAGRWPRGPGEAVLDVGTATHFHIGVGQSIRVAGAGRAQSLRVVGLVGYGTADSLAGATIVGMTLPETQAILGQPGRIYDVTASAVPGVTPTQLAARVAAALGPRFTVETQAQAIAATNSAVNKGFDILGDILLVFAGVALFVAVFLIFNTFSILLSQRARELALLRCLGATRRQIVTSVLAEAALLGLGASVLGVGLGVLLALGLRSLLAAGGISFPSIPPVVEPRTVVVSLLVGTVATMAAALLPAWRGSRVAPVAAMRDEPPVDVGRAAPLRVGFGTVASLVGAAMVVAALHGAGGRGGDASHRAELAGFGLALGFLGIGALVPLVVRPLAGALGWPAAMLRGVPGKLGRNNAMRHPRRTASTAAALMIGLVLISTIAVMSRSVQDSVDATLDSGLHAGYVFTSSGVSHLSSAVSTRLAAIGQLADVAPVTHKTLQIQLGCSGAVPPGGGRYPTSTAAPVTGSDVLAYARDVSIPVKAGSLAAVGPTSVAVTTGVAATWHLHVGSALPLGSPEVAHRTFTVAAIIGDPTGLTDDMLFSTSGLAGMFPQKGPKVDRIYAQPAPGVSPGAASAAVTRALRTYPQVKVSTKAGFINATNATFGQLIGIVTALLALAVVIAFFGIVNTLALSVVERRREIGLLRALGLSRRQLRAAVRWESVIVALLGTGLGIVLGVVFGWVVVRALHSVGVDVFAVPVVELLAFFVVAGIAGVLAAVVPARSAARVDVLAAITTE
jgi:putative ABC transport system permease protein